MANKIQQTGIESQSKTIVADNRCDEERALDIEARIDINNEVVGHIRGNVFAQENQAASFNCYGSDSLSISFTGNATAKADILEAVEDFIATAKEGGLQ